MLMCRWLCWWLLMRYDDTVLMCWCVDVLAGWWLWCVDDCVDVLTCKLCPGGRLKKLPCLAGSMGWTPVFASSGKVLLLPLKRSNHGRVSETHCRPARTSIRTHDLACESGDTLQIVMWWFWSSMLDSLLGVCLFSSRSFAWLSGVIGVSGCLIRLTGQCGSDLRRLKVEFPACIDGFRWCFITAEARAVSLVCEKVVRLFLVSLLKPVLVVEKKEWTRGTERTNGREEKGGLQLTESGACEREE
jgi:hypothetical protein